MSLLHRLNNAILAFLLTSLYISVSIFDRGRLNFDLWDKDVTNISFVLFFFLMFVLNLNLRPNQLTIDEKLENIEKHQNLKAQLNELITIKSKLETSLKNSLSKQESLVEKRKILFEKIQSAKRNISKEMQLKNKATIEHYNEKLEKLEDKINSIEPQISKKRNRLKVVYNKIELVERKKQSNELQRQVLDKKLKKIF
ncbi:hypothetical protein [Sulfurimonas sp.]|uniref:hypothetical protein n=1 Tax=Sulfurimonas sp. TaxID=2022749 RepID=UPI0035684698